MPMLLKHLKTDIQQTNPSFDYFLVANAPAGLITQEHIAGLYVALRSF
ncbi:hypothetical protein ALO99_101709 [Pseudomonas coronafaciens pv. porri]|uniref:Uncharacterized protein n=1 Tax=Pseudomonas cannabina TaxID=86840 RepID=A0A0P9MYK3_PSECA|nr:hypothetical protein ALO81_102142 [Pseudomonas cannabina]RMV98212.1 hypothetical protein ALP00_102232 [Pseudomonas coronafaciens pv. porri]RMW01892.1 hypothetical protein ALO99_101709 [Pseudomonas coronafaciens pv. porri]